MKAHGSKHSLSGIVWFSLLAAVFCAVLSVIAAAILIGSGNLLQAELRNFLIPAGATFVLVFAATFACSYYGLFWWLTKDEMADRVGNWQRAPLWFAHLMNHFIKGRDQKQGN